jgi:hypothetical protein
MGKKKHLIWKVFIMNILNEIWKDDIKPFVQKPLGKISLFFLYYLYFIHVPVAFLYNTKSNFMLTSQVSCIPSQDLWQEINLKEANLFQDCSSFETYLKSGFYLSIILPILLSIPFFMAFMCICILPPQLFVWLPVFFIGDSLGHNLDAAPYPFIAIFSLILWNLFLIIRWIKNK